MTVVQSKYYKYLTLGIAVLFIFVIGLSGCNEIQEKNENETINEDETNQEPTGYKPGKWIDVNDPDYENDTTILDIRFENYRNYTIELNNITLDDYDLPSFNLPNNSVYRFVEFDSEKFSKGSYHKLKYKAEGIHFGKSGSFKNHCYMRFNADGGAGGSHS